MDKPLSILLIEDEPLDCQEIIKCIEAQADARLVGVTNNTSAALEYVADALPDAIILDLELHKGYGNGLSFLHSMREMKLSAPIYVLVTTNNISQMTHDSARKMGADFIMLKSQEDYSAENVVTFLISLKNVIQSNKKTAIDSNHEESHQHKQQRFATRVMAELDHVGIPPNAVGRKYLIDGIMLVINHQNEKINLAISRKYGKTEASVERAMQNAIEKAWRTSPIDDLMKYYTARVHSSRGVPSVMEFLYYYAERIGTEY